MEGLKKANTVIKWIMFALLIVSVLTVFCPIYDSAYRNGEPENVYLYSNVYGASVSAITLLIPILAAVFLLTDFKNGKLISFGLIGTYIISNLFLIITLSRLADNDSSSYDYTMKYGYYLMMIETIFTILLFIVAIILYAIEKSNESKPQSNAVMQNNGQTASVDKLKERIELLTELKNNGILTESEYEQKRAQIVKEINI